MNRRGFLKTLAGLATCFGLGNIVQTKSAEPEKRTGPMLEYSGIVIHGLVSINISMRRLVGESGEDIYETDLDVTGLVFLEPNQTWGIVEKKLMMLERSGSFDLMNKTFPMLGSTKPRSVKITEMILDKTAVVRWQGTLVTPVE